MREIYHPTEARPGEAQWTLVGVPDHQGVSNVGGRIGAAAGPAAFRRALARLRGPTLATPWTDFGDTAPLGADVSSNHRAAAEHIRRAHAETGLSVVVGGGHDHGYSQLLALSGGAKATKPSRLGCINVDAHLDLRKPNPEPGSGSPFFLAIESGVLDSKRFVEFGIQNQCNAPDLWAYAHAKKIRVMGLREIRGKVLPSFRAALRALSRSCDQIVLSLDLDGAAEAFSPGVSAPQADGLTAPEIMEIVACAGAEKKVVSLGIFELNPLHDVADRSARLAATAVYHFLEAALSLRSRTKRA